MGLSLSGLTSGMDTDSMVKELMKAERLKETKLQNKLTKLEWQKEKWSGLNSKIYSFYTGPLSKIKLQGTFMTKKASSSNTDKVEITAGSTAPIGRHDIQVKSVASAQYVTGAKLDKDDSGKAIGGDTKLTRIGDVSSGGTKINIQAGSKSVDFEVDKNSTVDDLLKALQDAGLNANFDTKQGRFFISSKDSGTDNAFFIKQTSGGAGSFDLSNIGLSEIVKVTKPDGSVLAGGGINVAVVSAANAKIIYNGAEIDSASNNISINGLSLNIKKVTADDEVVSGIVTGDSQAVYDNVKSFIKSYNELLDTLNTTYNAKTAKGYEPLTDEEKEAMTDDQIEKWETKIKDSILRRDSIVNSVVSAMRTTMVKSVEVGGKDYSLSSFGITALDYTENGKYHIDGDVEDSLSGAKDDKLLKAINENPEAVMALFNDIGKEIYSTMSDQMRSTEISSALTVYNDKEMNLSIERYKKNLSDMEDKLANIEKRYYRQFSAMESALAKINSQSSSISAMLGTNS